MNYPFQYERIIWRFFDGVSESVSSRLLREVPPNEEYLSTLLCELLDNDSGSNHVLRYPIDKAKNDLNNSDIGAVIDIQITTHEHSKPFESHHSGSDIGVIFEVNHPIIGNSRRAVLLQAKKLFRQSSVKDYTIYSKYDSYNQQQCGFLKEIRDFFDVENSVFYLWYNPPSNGFSVNDSQTVKSYESYNSSFFSFLSKSRFTLGDFLHLTPQLKLLEEQQEKEWVFQQPALRISDLYTTLSTSDRFSPPTIGSLYESRRISPNHRGYHSFSPFANFFLEGLLGEYIGSSEANWIKLAEGYPVTIPTAKKDYGKSHLSYSDEYSQTVVPKHTINIKLQSTLSVFMDA